MMKPQKLIDSINNSIRISKDCSLRLNRSKYDGFRYIIEGEASALNRFPKESEEVKIIKWFKDFWLFLEIRFTPKENKIGKKKESQINICISLSVFQGEDSDNEKHQLFRAEWDDYNNPDEKHAQPHWHITSSQAIEHTFYRYADIYEEQDFLQVLESEKRKVFDVKRIHFAMNGDWQSSRHHIHKMENEQQIVRWLQGLLTYLKIELESLY